MPEHQDYYKILHVSENATLEEIKKSFRRLARDCHPDLNPNDAKAAERFRLLREAYEVLSDQKQRDRYDRHRPSSDQTGDKEENNPQVYYVRGVEKILLQDYQGAISALSEAIRLNGRFIEAYLKRCEAYLAMGEERATLEDCQQILRYQPDSAIAYYYRGRARQRLGYTDSAVKAYTKAIRLDQNFAPSYYYRGVANYELRYRNRAISDWREYAQVCKQQGDTQGYRLAMDTLSRYSWIQIKIGNRTLGQWWRIIQDQLDRTLQQYQLGNKIQNLFTGTLTNTQATLQAITAALTSLIKNPVGAVLITYGSLDSPRRGAVCVGLITLNIIGFLLGIVGQMGVSGEAFIRGLVLGITPILGLFLMSLITRSFLGHSRHWTGDLFLASSTVLPIAFLFSVSRLFQLTPASPLWWALAVFPFSHSILILYGGCSQLLNASESAATRIVPTMILMTLLLSRLVWVGLSLLFSS